MEGIGFEGLSDVAGGQPSSSTSELQPGAGYDNLRDPLLRSSPPQSYGLPADTGDEMTSYPPAKREAAGSGEQSLFFQDGVRHIDYVLAYRETSDDSGWGQTRAEKRRVFQDSLHDHYGIELEEEHTSNDGKTHYVKLHVPFKVLSKWAESMLMRMPIEQNNQVFHSLEEKCIDQVCCGKNPCAVDLEDEPDYYTALFRQDKGSSFIGWDSPDREKNFFSPAQRIRVCHEILSKAKYGGDTTKAGINRLLGNKTYTAAFPLHSGPFDALAGSSEDSQRAMLYREWGNWKAWYKEQPLDHIRGYFGEKVAIYFAWLGFYTRMLILPSVIGIIVFIFGCILAYGTNNPGKELCDLKDMNLNNNACNATQAMLLSGSLACRDVLMCPLCDTGCDYWLLSGSCQYARGTVIFDNGFTVFFAAFMALWATFFLEYWKRQQSQIAFDWDLTDFEEEEERPRAQYEAALKGKSTRENPITGIEEPYQPRSAYYAKITGALSAVTFFVFLVIGVIISILLYRLAVGKALYQDKVKLASIVTALTGSVLQVIAIIALNKIYGGLAEKLTEWELHRTQTEHEDSFSFKMFLFQFFNFYGSIFYIAFFKGNFSGYPPEYNKIAGYRLDECGVGGCLIELTIQLAIIMVVKQAVNNVMEVLVPRIKHYLAQRDNVESHGQDIKQWEDDLDLAESPESGLLPEYLEMVLQYGFVTLFVSAFPLAPLFALANNIIEIRLDANKMLTQQRRPFAARAEDIGIWYGILAGLSYMAVVTNALVIAITSGFIPQIVYRNTIDHKFNILGKSLGDEQTTDGYVLFSLSTIKLSLVDGTKNSTYTDKTLKKYLSNNPLFNTHKSSLVCAYRGDQRLPDGGDLTTFYWHSVAGRLAFVVAFEHIIFIVKGFIAWLVPDVPNRIKLEMRRENFHNKRKLQDLTL